MEDSVINKQLPKYMKIVDKDFILHSTHVIGKGSFGKVVYGRTKDDKDICFKFEKTAAHKNSILKEELKIYTQINGGIGVPSVISYGVYKTCRYIVMELAGPSLDKYFTLCEKKFKLETVIYLGLQMVDRIEYVHNKGFIHRDIKPNNFLFGKFTREMNSGDSTVHIIDFGLSTSYLEPVNADNSNKPNEFKSLLNTRNENINEKSSEQFKAPENIVNYQDDKKQNEYNIINTPINFHIKIPSCIQTNSNDNSINLLITKDILSSKTSLSQPINNISQNTPIFKHIPYKEGARFVGTPRYASLNTHQGIRQSRRDDLESISYILAYFLIGDLPWQSVKAKTKSEKKEKIRNLKLILNIETEPLFISLPQEIKEFIKYTRAMTYHEKPNYDYLRNLLITLRTNNNYPEFPHTFEWDDIFLEGQYSVMKKKYKTLFEGYPIIPFSSYLEYIEQKKNKIYKEKYSHKGDDLSLVETATNSSEMKKGKIDKRRKTTIDNIIPEIESASNRKGNLLFKVNETKKEEPTTNKFRISFETKNIINNQLLGKKMLPSDISQDLKFIIPLQNTEAKEKQGEQLKK